MGERMVLAPVISFELLFVVISFMAHKAVAEICPRHAIRVPLFYFLVLETLGPEPLDLRRDRERSFVPLLL